MNLLVVSATEAEIAPLIAYLRQHWHQSSDSVFSNGTHELHLLTTGVGMMPATYALTKALAQHSYQFAVQAGIAGSFSREISLGELVVVEQEILGDLGAEDHHLFHDVFDLELAQSDEFPFSKKSLLTKSCDWLDLSDLRKVSSLSVNTVSGSSFTANARQKKYDCDIENMEGAAFHYVCLKEGISFLQVRSISNYVEARNRAAWKIEEAVSALNQWLIRFIKHLSAPSTSSGSGIPPRRK